MTPRRSIRRRGDLSGGKRALELGVSEHHNAVALALAGAKALAVDPDPARIAYWRSAWELPVPERGPLTYP